MERGSYLYIIKKTGRILNNLYDITGELEGLQRDYPKLMRLNGLTLDDQRKIKDIKRKLLLVNAHARTFAGIGGKHEY